MVVYASKKFSATLQSSQKARNFHVNQGLNLSGSQPSIGLPKAVLSPGEIHSFFSQNNSLSFSLVSLHLTLNFLGNSPLASLQFSD